MSAITAIGLPLPGTPQLGFRSTYTDSSQLIPDWRRLQRPPTPQMPPPSGRNQVMILHFLFAVKHKIIGRNGTLLGHIMLTRPEGERIATKGQLALIPFCARRDSRPFFS